MKLFHMALLAAVLVAGCGRTQRSETYADGMTYTSEFKDGQPVPFRCAYNRSVKRSKLLPAEKVKLIKKPNNLRRWYERMLKKFTLEPRNERAA